MNERTDGGVNIQDKVRSISESISLLMKSAGIRPDADSAVLILLILCLYKNEADLKLILALGYILL